MCIVPVMHAMRFDVQLFWTEILVAYQAGCNPLWLHMGKAKPRLDLLCIVKHEYPVMTSTVTLMMVNKETYLQAPVH